MAETQLFAQVGGHGGINTTEDGSLIIKPALPLELQFYQTTLSDPKLERLQEFIPVFYGTLKLEGKVDETNQGDGVNLLPVEEKADEYYTSPEIVLENIAYPFIKPNILDIKLGTVLYDDDATPEKKERMDKTARETTSHETGVRLTGFQVYDKDASEPTLVPKSYGKSITSSQLPEGIAKFFPLAASEGSSSGLPRALLLPILKALRDEISEIRDAVANLEARLVATSLLIVYEADWVRAEEGVQKFLADDTEEEEEEDEGDDDDDDDAKKRPGMPCDVKLIDFAHTRLTPGEGPDSRILVGFDTVLRLLDSRIAEVEEVDP